MNMFESISSYNFVEVNGYAYFSNLFYNAFFKVELKTGKTFFLGNFENEMLAENNLHLEVMLEEDHIYFFPRRGRHMFVYQLSDQSMRAVEIRKKSECFFVIEEVILKDNYIYFIPKQNNTPIKRMEKNTFRVTNVSNKLIVQGKCLSKDRNIIPTSIVKKYNIQHGTPISCKQIFNGKWYCFIPVGRQLSCFSEGVNTLEFIPLTVVNEIEFQQYLYKVKQELFEARLFFDECDGVKFEEFLEATIFSSVLKENYYKMGKWRSMGEKIWKKLI